MADDAAITATDGTAPSSPTGALSSAPADTMSVDYMEHQSPEHQLEWRKGLAREAATIEMSGRQWALAYRARAGTFRAIGLYFALASAIVATLAGATGLAFPSTLTAALALAAAGLTAVSAIVGAPTRTQTERAISAQNWILCAKARVFRTTVAPYAAPRDVLTSFRQLCQQRDEVWTAAPVEGRVTQRRVNRKIQAMAAGTGGDERPYSDAHPFGRIDDLTVLATMRQGRPTTRSSPPAPQPSAPR
jgi:hypothetical protein